MAASKAAKKTKVRRRKYDNSSRAEKSVETQKKIIETLVKLLVKNRGGDVPMETLAQESGITQRTIFRFFKDKKSLHQAMDHYLLSYLQASAEQMSSLDFVGFAQNAFRLFDRHESLTMAYLFSPFGQEARALFRKKLNQAMIEKIVQETKVTANPLRLKRMALMTSMVNAKIWNDLRTDYGYSGEEMGEAVQWALTALMKQLTEPSQGS